MRVAICCEQIAPSELLRDAVAVGRALSERGHEVAYIVGDPLGLAEAGSGKVADVYQAPMRRAGPSLVMKSPAPDGFADVMATLGFDDKQTLLSLSAIWRRHFEVIRPDVILGFYAPTVWLVGPSIAPTFALGSGLLLPPKLETSFPRLSASTAPLADESMMLENINAVLLRDNQPAMATLSEILDRSQPILYGVPAFDPYLQLRRTVSEGLLGYEPNPLPPPVDQRLAAFLDIYAPGVETIVLGIAAFHECPIDVSVSGLTPTMRRFLEQQSHVRVWRDYPSLLDEIGSASGVIHHGVQDVAQRCMAFGRPQFIIPWTPEQRIFHSTANWMGFFYYKPTNTSVEEMGGTFRALLRDMSLAVAAQHHARQLADTGFPDALPPIVARVEAAVPVKLRSAS